MSYIAQVVADSSGQFVGNGLRFETHAQALAYARDLARRWTMVTDYRVVESDDPVNQPTPGANS